MSKESPSINFDPSDPKYREITDLPPQKRNEYVTLPKSEGGGFVKVSARAKEQHYDAKSVSSEERRDRNRAEALTIDFVRNHLIEQLDYLINLKKSLYKVGSDIVPTSLISVKFLNKSN